MLLIIIPMNKQEDILLTETELLSRRFVDQNFSELREEMKRITIEIINELLGENRYSRNVMKKQIKRSIAKYVKSRTRKEPMIVPILMDI